MLYDNEFDKLWEEIIEKMILFYKIQFGVKCKPMFLTKFLLKYFYNKYKELAVKTYMVWDTVNIDRHKIAACLLKAILIVKPLYIPIKSKLTFLFTNQEYAEILGHNLEKKYGNESLKKYFIFLNEYLAINISTAVLDSYIQSKESGSHFKHRIVIPEPFPALDHDYLRDVCIGLHYGSARRIEPIAYANAFFLWEKYSCRKTRCDNLSEAYKTLLNDLRKQEGKAPFSDEKLEEEVGKAMLAEQYVRLSNKKTTGE